MKKLLIFALVLIAYQSGYAQTEQFKKGQLDFQAGVGFINSLNITLNEAGVGGSIKSKFAFPPPTVSLDYGITDEISIGGYVNYTDVEYRMSNGDFIEQNKIIMIGARGLYHVDLLPKLDTYGGLGLAYGSLKATAPEPFGGGTMASTSGDLYYQFIAGGRYRFTKNTGVFVELGYGVTVINLGLNIKF